MDLGGDWLAAASNEDLRREFASAELDESFWQTVTVPGHWRSHPAFADSDGPILYRRRFSTAGPRPDRRWFLVFDGIFYQGDVWLDGEYLGDTEGYFFPHAFEITAAVAARTDHLMAVEVACSRPPDLGAKRNLTGVFQHWDCIDPDWNPGGIWRAVRIEETGPVRIRSLKVLCRDATEDAATLDLEAALDTVEPRAVLIRTTARQEGESAISAARRGGAHPGRGRQPGPLAADGGTAGVVVAARPRTASPFMRSTSAYGCRRRAAASAAPNPPGQRRERPARRERRGPNDQGPRMSRPADDPGGQSDRRRVTTGLRQVRLRNFIATVNGERLFLKGINCAPTRRALAEATCDELAGDITLARQAGLDLVRVHAHVTRPEFYEAADRQGMLIWQDLPLQWRYGQVRRQAMTQARQAVAALGHHPSVAVWCGHNEPFAADPPAGAAPSPRAAARRIAGQVLPSWNKTGLDRSIRRALERADGSRTVVAHSGVLPHPGVGHRQPPLLRVVPR